MVAMCHWHQIHIDCLLGLLQNIVLQPIEESGPRFICQGIDSQGKGCKEPLKSEAIELAMRKAQGDLAERLYDYRTKFKLASNLQPWQELAFCPTLNCGIHLVAHKDMFSVTCFKCKKLFCPHCCRRTHFGHPCIPIRYKLCRDCCVYCKQRQAVREGCSRVVCHSEFCQGERAYCTVCRVGLPLEQESCRKCHPPDTEPLLDPKQTRIGIKQAHHPVPPNPSRPSHVQAPRQQLRQNAEATSSTRMISHRPEKHHRIKIESSFEKGKIPREKTQTSRADTKVDRILFSRTEGNLKETRTFFE
jgi:hypothetical protein